MLEITLAKLCPLQGGWEELLKEIMGKTKTYMSRYTVPHFSVGMRRIAFHATTNGRAYYITDDEVLQKGIERHPWFNSKFFLESVEEQSADKQASDEQRSMKARKDFAEMNFLTLADAKNYLAEKFGVVRSNIKTQEAAISVGEANGVKITFGK